MENFLETKYCDYLIRKSEALEKQGLKFNIKISALMNSQTDELGTVLKSHLIIENYIDEYLLTAYPSITSWKDARLSFNQKLEIINNSKTIIAFLYQPIKELNSLRNKFSHQLSYQIKAADLKEIKERVVIWNKAAGKRIPEGLELLECFTILVCSFLDSTIQGIKDETPELGLSGYLKWVKDMMSKSKTPISS